MWAAKAPLVFAMAFKDTVALDKRLRMSNHVLVNYPDRVPVICERAARSDLPDIEKKKFVVTKSMMCGELKYIIQKYISQSQSGTLTADQTIYLFVKDKRSLKTGLSMSEIYEQHKDDDDGILYMVYSAENSLG